MSNHRIALALILAALAFSLVAPAAADPLELLGTVRANNRTESVTFRIAPRQARVSEIRVRSGSLPMHLQSVEILFADGGHVHLAMDDLLPPGRQSRPISVDPTRPVTRVLVMKRPGLPPGETALQLLGKPAQSTGAGPPLRPRR